MPADRPRRSTDISSTDPRRPRVLPGTRTRVAGALAAVAALTLVACGPPPPGPADRGPAGVVSPPSGPSGACDGAGAHAAGEVSAPVAPAALTPEQAGTEARDAAAEAIADPALPGRTGSVPVVVTTVDEDGRPEVRQVVATDPADAADAVRDVAQDAVADGDQVVGVETERQVRATGPARATETVADGTWDAAATNDQLRSWQWALNQLPFESAWNRTTGAGVCVAVVDSGVEVTHPDLGGRVVASADWTGQGVSAPGDHGTHVAGIIAAVANNGLGVSGAAPGVDLLNAKVLNSIVGSGYESWVAAGIIWSVDMGADVVNLSLGAPCLVANTTNCLSTTMRTAIDYARFHDVVVVVSAGNDGGGSNTWTSPAAADWSIATASVSSNGARSWFSTQASYVDVAAPGDLIWSTVTNSSYGAMSGTSMAAPYVSALAAMTRAVYPAASATEVRNHLLSTAADRGAPGVDPAFGHGVIDPLAATG